MVMMGFVGALTGAIAGLGLEKAAGSLIQKRLKPFQANRFSGGNYKTAGWMLINAVVWFVIFSCGGMNLKSVEYALLVSAFIVLSAVDIATRKIPNEIILFVLFIGLGFLFLEGSKAAFGIHLIGFGAGLLLFLLPAIIGKSAGMGDVKCAAVMGFCLGLYHFLAAMALMSVVLLCYTGYLLITGKGGLKSKVALGPFMASGTVAVLLLSLVNTKFMLLDLGLLF